MFFYFLSDEIHHFDFTVSFLPDYYEYLLYSHCLFLQNVLNRGSRQFCTAHVGHILFFTADVGSLYYFALDFTFKCMLSHMLCRLDVIITHTSSTDKCEARKNLIATAATNKSDFHDFEDCKKPKLQH
jgi:hypothetical protein